MVAWWHLFCFKKPSRYQMRFYFSVSTVPFVYESDKSFFQKRYLIPGNVIRFSGARSSAVDSLEDSRSKLLERGEKLSALDQKSSQLENDALNFKDLAEQLSKKQKWWQ
mmetsp:Transcript_11173/g.15216  ORF Transcript_11173/g.15216 Transcript_11173/m.15216 type:complete len:109 (+) Transcript_11173:895-1221(+)